MSSLTSTNTTPGRQGSTLAPMLLLDIANLASWRRAAPVIVVAMAGMAWSSGVQMAVLMLYVGSAFMAFNPFTMDERYRLPLLYGGLPVTRRTVITSHYLIAVGALAMAMVLVVPCALLSHAGLGLDIGEEIQIGLLTITGASVVLGPALPLVIRFGVKVLSYAYLGVLGLFAGLAMLTKLTGLGPVVPLESLATWAETHLLAAVSILAVVVVGIWVASYLVSVRWFEAKDF